MTTVQSAAATGTGEATVATQLSLPVLIALHIVPGALMTVGFVVLAPVAERVGFPPIAALLAAILLVLVPIELGVLRWAAHNEGTTVRDLIPYRRPIPARVLVWLVPVLIVLAFLGFGLHQPFEPALIERFFAWLPEWFVKPIVIERAADYSTTAWIVTFIAYFAVNGLIGPIVEELYFRGYLLPRMDRYGRWAPLINVSLFSIYHFWSPWEVLARILGLGPTVYAVRWQRNVYLGMAVHCTLNILGVSIVASMIFGRI